MPHHSPALDKLLSLSCAEIVTRLRAAGWTLEEIAQRCETTRGYVSQVESGKRVPGERIVLALQRLAVDRNLF